MISWVVLVVIVIEEGLLAREILWLFDAVSIDGVVMDALAKF
jgi:hypothetical protein